MSHSFFDDQTYNNIDFTLKGLPEGEYDNCNFESCHLEGVNLNNRQFSECIFTNCNLSNTTIEQAAFRDATFNNCKLLGLRFDTCNQFIFSVRFANCSLNLAAFYKCKMKKTMFSNCSLQEVDFVETDLTQVVFDNCDLSRAIFDNTILEKADFTTAYSYTINPANNRIKKAKFATTGLAGLLSNYDIVIV